MLSLRQPSQLVWSTLKSKPLSLVVATRNFAPQHWKDEEHTYRGDVIKRIGYGAKHHHKGLLPRLKIKEARLPHAPSNIKEEYWTKRNALEGQNDFMSILGEDEDFKQYELLDHVPDWLKGYSNMHSEYSVLMRKRKEFEHWKVSKPLKWLHMEQRIKFLYRRINNKYKPPDVEKLHTSRHRY